MRSSNTKKSWKSYLEGRVSTPQIMPKANHGAIPRNKSSKARERIPTSSDELPHPQPKTLTGLEEHYQPQELQYLESTTTLHLTSLSVPYRQNHLPRRARLNIRKFLISNPPSKIGAQTLAQLTRWYLNSLPIPPYKKSHWSFSIGLATQAGMGKRDKNYVGRSERVLLIRVTLPPFDKYIIFQLTNRHSIFSTMLSQIDLAL